MPDTRLEYRPPIIETPADIEGRVETAPLASEEIPRNAGEELRLDPADVAVPSSAPVVVRQVSPIHRQIEQILQEDLLVLYRDLTPEQKTVFRTQGELTAGKIEVLLQETKVRVREIVKLIALWLSFLPGVNKFFVEQEAKLKADKILFLRRLPTVE